MKPTGTFVVAASLPEALEPLREIAYNLRWCWDRDTIELFRRIDRDLWEETEHNPVKLLGSVSQEVFERLAQDEGFLSHLQRVRQGLKEYMESNGWARDAFDHNSQPLVAYFSAEFGITESLSLYSGGLGVLAGDTLKSASDLGCSVVGVGILYRQGYFHQYLNRDGWQQEAYTDSDFYTSPVELVRRDGNPVLVEIPLAGCSAKVHIWRAQVGRVPLLLLDTNMPENPESVCTISARLYEGDTEQRLRQEILLGIGGVRALAALGLSPVICHMNDGHSAFLTMERIRMLMKEHGLSFEEARIATSAGNVFTTHTPVQAASDRFDRQLVEKYLGGLLGEVGLKTEEFMALGREDPTDSQAPICMTALAFRLAESAFGVSKLHGQVSRHIWNVVWPQAPEQDVPIGSVTNGVHMRSWVSREMADLFDQYVGPHWRSQPSEPEDWNRVDSIPDEELWQVHERRRHRLVAFARKRLREQLVRTGASPSEVDAADRVLDVNALTIGFARRFTTYKRATLIFQDAERIRRICSDHDRPVQIILAGKAHPADKAGKELIKRVIHLGRDEQFGRRIIFLENHDMMVARYLVQGADVWLNTPRRPQEASGTSGMKAAVNGVANLSVLDGWWCEGYEAGAGWAIGNGEEYEDTSYQDAVESAALYDLLEKEVVPMFYDRDSDERPHRWIAMMKKSIRRMCPVFNTNRMLGQYVEEYYVPGAARWTEFQEGNFEKARRLAEWQARVREAWTGLAIKQLKLDNLTELRVGSTFTARALVNLGKLTPSDVSVDLYLGKVDARGHLSNARAVPLNPGETVGKGEFWFEGQVTSEASGRHGYSVRILPKHEYLRNPYALNSVVWS